MKKNLLKISIILVCLAVMAIINVYAATTITTNQSGYHDGFYYLFWKESGGGPVTMTLGPGGNYSVTWSNCIDFYCGKGWNPGSARTINYTGTFNVSGNGWIGVTGWTQNQLVEYYVVENYGSWTPPGGSPQGVVTTDGGTYYLYRTLRVNMLCIEGIKTYYQYWSVRTSRRSSGTITLSNHFNAWASKGWNLGTKFNYQIFETEGYQSSGSSNITVSEVPVIPTPTRRP